MQDDHGKGYPAASPREMMARPACPVIPRALGNKALGNEAQGQKDPNPE